MGESKRYSSKYALSDKVYCGCCGEFLSAEPGTAIIHPKKWYGNAKRMSMKVKQHVMPNRLMNKFYILRLYDYSTGCMRTRKDATIEIRLEGISESQAAESD
ncbi:hypothetical protein [Paenibacillus polymyxa]|uniref:hypothetical protein n=1 Tax=Paenibacillus polymyxa TaxID=1406 RepID=UPI0020242F3B|nr:hypothetical protein [Paenibacillus polymyxa]URJ59059.3 hypothetical protein MF622_003663 [Paenibacillus polymyxa]